MIIVTLARAISLTIYLPFSQRNKRLTKCKYGHEPVGFFERIPPEIPLDCKEQTTGEGDFCINLTKSFGETTSNFNQNYFIMNKILAIE